MDPQKNESVDDWLNEGVAEAIKKEAKASPPRTMFPTVPSGVGVPKGPEPPPPKQKSLQTIGIGRGGIVRNATTVVRTALNNPVANPKAGAKASIIDRADLTPEFGISPLMTGMDANFEQETKEKLENAERGALPNLPAPQEEPPREKYLTVRSTLADIIEMARMNGGLYETGNSQFILQLELKRPF